MSLEAGKKRGRPAASGDKKAKRKLKRKETYSVYIYKVLKQVSKGLLAAGVATPLLLHLCPWGLGAWGWGSWALGRGL